MPMHYLQNFWAIGVLFKGDVVESEEKVNPVTASEEVLLSTVRRYSAFFCDLASLDYDSLQFEDHILALACIYCARKTKNIRPLWCR